MALTLVEKVHLTDNVWSFRFKSDKPLHWTPGQFIYVELPHDNPDGEGTKRWFTVSSAPYEGVIQITTRVTGTTFKTALSKLPVGGPLTLVDAPDGDFVWEDKDLPLVFVAGGIGITPFHSILAQRAHDHEPLNVTLIYTGRTPDVPFKDEIALWQKQDAGLKVDYVTGGRLTTEKLKQLVPDLDKSLVYISGPEPMVESLGDELRASGLTDDHLKQDFFPNYDDHNF